MKRTIALISALSLLLTAGCGDNDTTKNAETFSDAVTTEAETEESTTTAVTTTAADTTEAVTTTKASGGHKEASLKGEGTVEVYQEITLGDYITEKNVELKDPDMLLETDVVGHYIMTVDCTDGGSDFEAEIEYDVVDTTPPLLINSGWTPYHKVGTAFDLDDYVGYADNYDQHPVLTFTGDIDPDTNGIYPLTATVTDSSGNETSWDLDILVVDEIPAVVDDNPSVDFGDFITRYDDGNVRFGIDVSVWQRDIDFNAVKEAGCSFVMIRIGYYYSQITMDDYFRANIAGAKAAGLDVGVYFYTTDTTADGVKEHVKWIAEQLDGEELEFPVAFDWEEFTNFQQYGMSIHDLNELYMVFADEVESYGYTSMLYSSRNFLRDFWSEKVKARTPVWLAHFTDETDYEGDYDIWQASAYGRIPGINGNVDMNILYNS